MPYEIPQQLQYEEKIVFGLTFRQLAYACLFGLPSIAIFKSGLGFLPKVVLIFHLIGFAVFFMFFGLSKHLRNMLTLFRFREVSLMDAKMIQFLNLEKIESGAVYVWKSPKPVEKRK